MKNNSYPYVRTDIDDIIEELNRLKRIKIEKRYRQRAKNGFVFRENEGILNKGVQRTFDEEKKQQQASNVNVDKNRITFQALNTNQQPQIEKPLPRPKKPFIPPEATASGPQPLESCPSCGRKFNPQSLPTHMSICQRVFGSKRQIFVTHKYSNHNHNNVHTNQRQSYSQSKSQEKSKEKSKGVYGKYREKNKSFKKGEQIPKWKVQSLAFRAMLKKNRNQEVNPKQISMLKKIEDNSMVKCPHCNRKFNEHTAKRHIPFCLSQQKRNAINNKNSKSPNKNNRKQDNIKKPKKIVINNYR